MKIKRNKKSYRWFLCGLILVVVLTISYRVSKANYRISNSIELTTGKVISSPYDFNLISMYIDGVEQDKSTILPSTIANYTINESETYCYKESKSNKDNNVKISINILGELVIKGISKGSKCILSLNSKEIEAPKTMSELLNNHYMGRKVRQDGTFGAIIENTTMGVIYEAQDDYGTSYYFAGNPLDNWVEFGGYYWRIIRINGDGSIRMIYQGRVQDENGNKLEAQTTGAETQVGISAFNEKYDDNAYVGYMYGTPNSSTHEETHTNINGSTIKQVLDTWFSDSNIREGTEYFNKIDLNAGFCGDRQSYIYPTLELGTGGFGMQATHYGPRLRILDSINNSVDVASPSYKCSNDNDLYTYNKSNIGNKKLANPVGLITVDEVAYAGLVYGKYSANNYLFTNKDYWTISPAGMGSIAYNFRIDVTYGINGGYVNAEYGLRPTINLKKDVTFTGNGTESNPYKVV